MEDSEMPPQSLQFMRLVVNGGLPEPDQRGPVWQSMVAMQASSPERFNREWHAAEMEWANRRKDSGSASGPDVGSEAALAVLDRWLKAHGEGS